MITEQLFPDPVSRQRLYEGPLVSQIDTFAERLSSQGYADSSAREKLRLIAGLSRWLNPRNLKTHHLNEKQICRFLSDRSRMGFADRDNAATCRSFLEHLRKLGFIPVAPVAIDDSLFAPIENDYAHYLSEERGLAPATLLNYLPVVRRFLTERFSDDPPILVELCPEDTHQFILRHVHTMSPGRAKLTITALRSFFRFLHQHNHVAMDLAGAIPGVANWRFDHIPKLLTAEQVEQILVSCDRNSAAGQRDFAVLLFLARLGLRAGEIVSMTLSDIDWEAGLFTVRGKGSRHETMPLPQDVGEALANYLQCVRPPCTTRCVFVRLKAPHHGFSSSVAICNIVRRALARAGLDPAFKGAHLLRHSLATRMLRNGATLAEIGDILRHSQPQTTQIYAKVDITALRALAQSWPGAVV